MPLEQLGTYATTTPDGVSRQSVFTHADYPRLGDNNALRTTGYNLAIIAAGLASDPAHPNLLVRP